MPDSILQVGADYTEDLVLGDGTPVRLRMIRPEDKDRLRAGFERLSPESRYLRFFAPKSHLTEAELRYLTELDGVDHVAIGAARIDDDGEVGDGLGVARFIRVADEPDCAEAAIAVLDEIQGRGLGTLLFLRLVAAAKARGIVRFRCEVLGENAAMVEMISGLAPERTVEVADGVSTIELVLPDVAPREAVAAAPRTSPLFRFFRHVAEGALEWREAVARLALRRREPDPDVGTDHTVGADHTVGDVGDDPVVPTEPDATPDPDDDRR